MTKVPAKLELGEILRQMMARAYSSREIPVAGLAGRLEVPGLYRHHYWDSLHLAGHRGLAGRLRFHMGVSHVA